MPPESKRPDSSTTSNPVEDAAQAALIAAIGDPNVSEEEMSVLVKKIETARRLTK